jgi:hypothetical protein
MLSRDIAATSSVSDCFWLRKFMHARDLIGHRIVRPERLDERYHVQPFRTKVSFVQNGWKVTYFVHTRYVKRRSRRTRPRLDEP